LSQVQLNDANFDWVSQLQALPSKDFSVMMQADENSTQAGFRSCSDIQDP